MGPLVKAFQNEVDALSKRSKAAEKAYFDVYKQVILFGWSIFFNPEPRNKNALLIEDVKRELCQANIHFHF